MDIEHTIASAFRFGGRIIGVAPYGNGIINDTYRVGLADSNSRKVILQRINHHVFLEPAQVMENLRIVLDHMHTRQGTVGSSARDLRLPEIYLSRDGQDFVVDAEGGFWRALSFIDGTISFNTLENARQAEEVGFALGRFHALLHALEPNRLHDTLPGFHITPHYFARFVETAAGVTETSAELDWCLAFVEARSASVSVLEDAKGAGVLPIRTIHGDPKLNNILFDAFSGHAVSLIDLDTVKPGLIQYDIGDCLRSCCNTAGETPSELAAIDFDLDICKAVLTAYVEQARCFLTDQDYAYLFAAIRLIPFELGLRFLTDHLQGNRYFKTRWPQQNLHRAMAQFTLTTRIERHEGRIRRMIDALSGA